MINSSYENSSIQIVEPPTPEIINLVFEEIQDRESSEFNESHGMDIFPSSPEMTSLTTSFSVTTSIVPPPISEKRVLSFLTCLEILSLRPHILLIVVILGHL